jgi:adenosylhomocysteinase
MTKDIKDISLADQGRLKISWAVSNMPVLNLIKKRFLSQKPFNNIIIGACLHVTSETANLMKTLKAGGAKLALCASNPLSTQDQVAASLVKHDKIPVFAINSEDHKTYFKHIKSVLDFKPHITLDDGGDLISQLHKNRQNQIKTMIGSCEETTTGVIRLRAMEKDKALKLPVIAVNDSQTKKFFDNRYGTGQSTIDGIMRATNILLAGKNFVVAGYGWCGRGIATRARGMGANVIVCEVDPVKALEAKMDGFQVLNLEKAVKKADIIVTATGNKQVIDKKHLINLKTNVILANSGHFNVEINVLALDKLAQSKKQIRKGLVQYQLKDKKINLLAEGRLVNLACAEGHPAEVMDLSFSNQALGCEYLLKNKQKLESKVYILPAAIDQKVASLKLKAQGIKINALTRDQKKYLQSWQEGT